jgi:hypothetical protein
MFILDKEVKCRSRSERIELFPFFDTHVGKRNCAEHAIKKQITEILRRDAMPDRHVFVLLGGDQVNAINTADLRRFDFNELADWFIIPSEVELAQALSERDVASIVRAKLSNICEQEVSRFVSLFEPIKHLIIGALYGNHEKSMRTKQNVDVHSAVCTRLGITNLTDEALIRFRCRRGRSGGQTITVYARHGYGAGRTAGAEPNKLARMQAEWECADICFSGHSHSFQIMPPKPVPYITETKNKELLLRYTYRFAANPGCWLYSHYLGEGSYESISCYPAKPMMTCKAVIWPFYHTQHAGMNVERPKAEIREYPIL